jgi:iron complex outermembrane receptor protein
MGHGKRRSNSSRAVIRKFAAAMWGKGSAWHGAWLALVFLPIPFLAHAQETPTDTVGPAEAVPDTVEQPAAPDTLQPEAAPDTLPAEAASPDTLQPETAPPDTLAPEVSPPDSIPPQRTRPTSEVLLSPEILVEITRLGTGGIPLGRIPYGIQILPGEEVREEASLTIADALVRLPGVTAADQFGVPYQPDIRVRGFAVSPVVGLPQSLSVFVDGVRINEPEASQVQFDLLPLEDVEQIEAVRGPGGPFGRNTLAAALNITTRRGSGPLAGELEVGGGSYGRLEGRGALSGTRGAFDYYASGRYHETDGWREQTPAEIRQGFAKLGYRSGGTDAWLSYTVVSNEILQPGSLPRSFLEGGPLPDRFEGIDDPREINFTGGDFYKPELHFLNATLSRELSPSLTLFANGHGRFLDVDQFNANISEPDFRGLTDIKSGGATLQFTLRPEQDGMILTGGAEYVRHDVDIQIFELPSEFFPDVDTTLTEHVGTEEENAGVFLQAWAPLTERLSATGSIRFDHVHVPFLDFLEPDESGTNDFNELSGVAGLNVQVAENAFVFGSYGRGFRAPVILEITCSDPEDPCPLPFELGADPPIDPVTADAWSAGGRYLSEGLSLEGVLYWTDVYDDIFNVILPPSTRGFFQNVEKTRRQGIELTLSALPTENLALNAGLALTRATFRTNELLASALLGDDDEEGVDGQADDRRGTATPGATLAGGGDGGDGEGDGGGNGTDEEGGPTEVEPGDEFSMVPNVSVNLGADYEVGEWSFSLDGVFVGSQWLTGDESNVRPQDKLDPYFVLDAYIGREFGPFEAFALIENLLDVEYETFGIIATNPLSPVDPEAIDPFYTPGMPLRVHAGIRYTW